MKPSVRTKIILALMLLPLGELHSLSAWAENAPVLACSRGEDFTLHANGARFEETALVYKNGNRVEQLVESFASRAMDGPARRVPFTMDRCRIAIDRCTKKAGLSYIEIPEATLKSRNGDTIRRVFQLDQEISSQFSQFKISARAVVQELGH